MTDRSIVLAGFMGTGKTTVAAALGQALARPVIDMDALIVERTGYTIARIFSEEGEGVFRAIEHGIALELALRAGLVVAAGGGAVMNALTRDTWLRRCFVVCLMATPQTIEQRLAGSLHRPLAANWRALLEQRMEVYASLPRLVWTDDRTPTQVAEEIVGLWNVSQ
jgi:shikimate kinase